MYSHTKKYQSATYSAQIELQQELHRLQISIKKMLPHSPLLRWQPRDFLAYKRLDLAAKQALMERVLANIEEAKRFTEAWNEYVSNPLTHTDDPPPPPLRPAFNGILYPNCLGYVLCKPTIFCPTWFMPDPTEPDPAKQKPQADWPCAAEMKWEGEDRARTNFGRQLPLPRMPASANNGTVAWHMKNAIKSHKFDYFPRVPTGEDIYCPVDEIEEEDVGRFINKGLLEAIDDEDQF